MAKPAGPKEDKVVSTRVPIGLSRTLKTVAERLPGYTVSDVLRWALGFTLEYVWLGSVVGIDDIEDPALRAKFEADVQEGLRNPDGSRIPGKKMINEKAAEVVSEAVNT